MVVSQPCSKLMWKLIALHLFKKSVEFNVSLKSLIDKGNSMFTTNLLSNSNSFALPQKMLIYDGIFDGVLMVRLHNYL